MRYGQAIETTCQPLDHRLIPGCIAPPHGRHDPSALDSHWLRLDTPRSYWRNDGADDEDLKTFAMARIRLVEHIPGAPGLRWLGMGPGLRPTRGLLKLQRLLDKHAFWAQGRSQRQLRRMLQGSEVVVSLWRGKRMVGFGRASSDGIYRAVLWDVVVAGDLQGRGLGRRVVEALLASPRLRNVERVYLMTTNSSGFYQQLGFQEAMPQCLLVRKQ